MGQGQYTLDDIQQPAAPAQTGQYSAADLDTTTTTPQTFNTQNVFGERLVTPLPGESFQDTMKRAIAAGKTVTPAERQRSTQIAAKQAPGVLAASLGAGPAVLGAGVALPEAASSAVGGGILGSTAAGATGGAAMQTLISATQGKSPISKEGALDIGKAAILGGAGGAAVGALNYAPRLAGSAGQSLQDVKTVAGNVPIKTGKVGDAALDLYEQSQRGAVLPKSVRQLVMRLTDPEGEPLTYGEAKDFQSNISRLSANERMNLNANTARLVGQLNGSLKEALTDAADTVGKGEQFVQAMKDYHSAMTIKGMTEAAKAELWKIALGAAGVYGAKKIWDAGQ